MKKEEALNVLKQSLEEKYIKDKQEIEKQLQEYEKKIKAMPNQTEEKNPYGPRPNLILMDGGITQVRVAKNVARYNKEMYKNWTDYFYRFLHHKLANALTYCNDSNIISSLYQLASSNTLEDLISSCKSFIKVTKDKKLHRTIEDLRDDIQTILA